MGKVLSVFVRFLPQGRPVCQRQIKPRRSKQAMSIQKILIIDDSAVQANYLRSILEDD